MVELSGVILVMRQESGQTAGGDSRNFIQQIIENDLASGACREVITRFPPEPNGYLHIGHAKAICLNFGLAARYGGRCHLRYDDTNPETEDSEYVGAIQEDIRWLGFDWGEHIYHASDYFDRMAEYAVELIGQGKAYVCNLSPEEFKQYRGTPTRPGREPPGRRLSPGRNLELFQAMRRGEFADGSCVLRARIDMASPNLHLRDPAIYRIKRVRHHRTGESWCIYPMYDFAHCLEDAIESVTHSLCTLEFAVHRPLYDWILETLQVKQRPRQYEFARLNLSYTVMSKRRLQRLVGEGHVGGWDDPRLPTLAGLRRRGYTPASIRAFADVIGVTRYDSLTDMALLEHCLRDDLNRNAPRRMAVMNPLKLVIDNYPEQQEEYFEAVNNPENPDDGVRPVPFCRELWIDRDDFMEDPPAKFHRLAPGREVRLRYACLFRCSHVVRHPRSGEVIEVHGTFDPESRGGRSPDGRRVRGTIHWVSARHAIDLEARLYDRLFSVPDPLAGEADFTSCLNPESLLRVRVKAEPCLAGAGPGEHVQFERCGYFYTDPVDHVPGAPVFNRAVALRDRWSRLTNPDRGKPQK